METTFLARKGTHYFLMLLSIAVLTMTPMMKRDAHALVVFDPSNFYANLNTYYQTLEQVYTSYRQLEAQYNQLKAMTSQNYWTDMVTKRPSWLPENYEDTQNMMEAGYNPGDSDDIKKWQGAKGRYQSKFPALTQTQVSKNPTDRAWVTYNHTKANTDEAMATSEMLHGRIAGYRKTVKELGEAAKNTEDLKSSVDMTNALLFQNAQMQLDTMETMKQQLQLAAVAQNRDLAAQAMDAEFFKKP